MKTTKEKETYQGRVTKEQFNSVEKLYDFFNKHLFKGRLPSCLINFSRKSKAMGFFAANKWEKVEGPDDPKIKSRHIVHEISLNPDFLHISTMEYCQTLVHEMCHLEQFCFGKPTAGYHNQEFEFFMKRVGLQTSSTGRPGGETIGKKMADYAIEDGIFLQTIDLIPENVFLPFIAKPDAERKKKSRAKNKTKYTCPGCESAVWGKPGMSIICGECYEGLKDNAAEDEEFEIPYYVANENGEISEHTTKS